MNASFIDQLLDVLSTYPLNDITPLPEGRGTIEFDLETHQSNRLIHSFEVERATPVTDLSQWAEMISGATLEPETLHVVSVDPLSQIAILRSTPDPTGQAYYEVKLLHHKFAFFTCMMWDVAESEFCSVPFSMSDKALAHVVEILSR